MSEAFTKATSESSVTCSQPPPRLEQVVELRVFAGMTVPEVAHVLEVSERTVYNDWRVAKMWLGRELAREEES